MQGATVSAEDRVHWQVMLGELGMTNGKFPANAAGTGGKSTKYVVVFRGATVPRLPMKRGNCHDYSNTLRGLLENHPST